MRGRRGRRKGSKTHSVRMKVLTNTTTAAAPPAPRQQQQQPPPQPRPPTPPPPPPPPSPKRSLMYGAAVTWWSLMTECYDTTLTLIDCAVSRATDMNAAVATEDDTSSRSGSVVVSSKNTDKVVRAGVEELFHVPFLVSCVDSLKVEEMPPMTLQSEFYLSLTSDSGDTDDAAPFKLAELVSHWLKTQHKVRVAYSELPAEQRHYLVEHCVEGLVSCGMVVWPLIHLSVFILSLDGCWKSLGLCKLSKANPDCAVPLVSVLLNCELLPCKSQCTCGEIHHVKYEAQFERNENTLSSEQHHELDVLNVLLDNLDSDYLLVEELFSGFCYSDVGKTIASHYFTEIAACLNKGFPQVEPCRVRDLVELAPQVSEIAFDMAMELLDVPLPPFKITRDYYYNEQKRPKSPLRFLLALMRPSGGRDSPIKPLLQKHAITILYKYANLKNDVDHQTRREFIELFFQLGGDEIQSKGVEFVNSLLDSGAPRRDQLILPTSAACNKMDQQFLLKVSLGCFEHWWSYGPFGSDLPKDKVLANLDDSSLQTLLACCADSLTKEGSVCHVFSILAQVIRLGKRNLPSLLPASKAHIVSLLIIRTLTKSCVETPYKEVFFCISAITHCATSEEQQNVVHMVLPFLNSEWVGDAKNTFYRVSVASRHALLRQGVDIGNTKVDGNYWLGSLILSDTEMFRAKLAEYAVSCKKVLLSRYLFNDTAHDGLGFPLPLTLDNGASSIELLLCRQYGEKCAQMVEFLLLKGADPNAELKLPHEHTSIYSRGTATQLPEMIPKTLLEITERPEIASAPKLHHFFSSLEPN